MMDIGEEMIDRAWIEEEGIAKIEQTLIEQGLVSHQMRSFDDFMNRGIQNLMDDMSEIEIITNKSSSTEKRCRHVKLRFRKVYISKPDVIDKNGDVRRLLPNEAMCRNFTYSAKIEVDVHIKICSSDQATSNRKGKGCVLSDKNWNSQENKSSYPNGKQQSFSALDDPKEEFVLHELCERVLLGRIPVMLNSSYCHTRDLSEDSLLHGNQCLFDLGGYFIIKGSEKVLISQEELAHRFRCMPLKDNKGFQGKLPILTKGLYSRLSYVTVNLKFNNVIKGRNKENQAHIPYITVQIPYFKQEINAVILFRALGVTSDKDLMDIMCIDVHSIELIMPSLKGAEEEIWNVLKDEVKVDTEIEKRERIRNAALKLVGSKLKNNHTGQRKESASGVLERYLFPDVNHDLKKAILLGCMISEVISCSLGRCKTYDRDSMENKRLDVAGDLFLHEFKREMCITVKQLKLGLQKALLKDTGTIDVQKHLNTSILLHGFEKAFATGNWALPPHKTGVGLSGGIAVTLARTNALEMISILRQTELHVNMRADLRNARLPNKLYIGRLCLVQSPDGDKCGLVKSLALLSHVTLETNEDEVFRVIEKFGVESLDTLALCELKSMSKVSLNGNWIAATNEPKKLAEHLRFLRRSLDISFEVEVAEDSAAKEIRIRCDSGRILRPLIILKHFQNISILNSKKLTMMELLGARILEFIGPDEESNCVVAADLREVREKRRQQQEHFTHAEIHSCYMFGLGASLIPFSNHNNGSRVMFQAQKLCKQAIGHYTTCLRGRVGKSGQHLLYPQVPLVNTRVSRLINKKELVNGQNVVVAICPFFGYNQEDSIVMNESSIQRGLLQSMHYKGYSTTYDKDMVAMMKPASSDARRSIKSNNAYDKLDDDGLPYIGANLARNEVIFGRVSIEHTNAVREDRSIDLRMREKGRVDKVMVAVGEDENIIARVILSEKRSPVVGDKFSSMHGQKGVVGYIAGQHEMPFTRQGIVPDVIINPHSFPSRQTTGQLLETHLGKLSALTGKRDGTAFRHQSIDVMIDELHGLGYQRWGEEVMFNGQTGEAMEAKIFVGCLFYQRLTKMAEDQVKFRSKGPTHPLTRQPVDDRQRHGGVRIGEMERDCLLAHGAAINVQERLFRISDPYQIHICQGCNAISSRDSKASIRVCKFCKTSKYIVQVDVPYACKLLYQELLSMGIFMRFQSELD